jgi:hypothetical protein
MTSGRLISRFANPFPEEIVVAMSLRGSACEKQETTEAISQGIKTKEIAALPLVARNDP